jgi:hypothetical protein
MWHIDDLPRDVAPGLPWFIGVADVVVQHVELFYPLFVAVAGRQDVDDGGSCSHRCLDGGVVA